MPVRNAKAEWKGNLKSGHGTMELGSGAFKGDYSAASRFENAEGTNPDELIGAAHAGCFSMALAGQIAKAGFDPKSIETKAEVTIEQEGEGFSIKKVLLKTEADIPGIDEDKFNELANKAKEGCPVSKALAGTQIELEAKLLASA